MTAPSRAQSGIGVPLFSLVSSQSWGIGEFADLPAFGGWCIAAGQRYVQLLPLNETSPGETSPYSSMSAMALDPIYIRLGDVDRLRRARRRDGARRRRPAPARRAAGRAADPLRRGAEAQDALVRRSYLRFADDELARATPRAEAFRAYEARQSWWLDAYTTFRAIHAAHEERAWWDWPPALAFADPEAVREAAAALSEERRYRAYLQWIAEEQWQAARSAASVRVFGDLSFMVSGDSPDVWARKQEFMLDATVGVPPDAFSATGQDWGLPPWRLAGDAGHRLPVDARPRPPDGGALRRRAHRSPGRALSHVRPPTDERCRNVLAARTSGRRASSARRCSASTWPAASRW